MNCSFSDAFLVFMTTFFFLPLTLITFRALLIVVVVCLVCLTLASNTFFSSIFRFFLVITFTFTFLNFLGTFNVFFFFVFGQYPNVLRVLRLGVTFVAHIFPLLVLIHVLCILPSCLKGNMQGPCFIFLSFSFWSNQFTSEVFIYIIV